MMRLLRAILLFAAGAAAAVRVLLAPSKASADAATAEARAGRADRKGWWLQKAKLFAAFLAVLAVGGFLFAASGIYPIGARSGHLGIVRWFLNFSSTRAVVTHTIGVKTPSLDEPWLVLKGAGHYETGCRPCHGSPDLPHPRVARQMTPQPPYLPPVISEWEPDELFYIVKNGLKFTGMPAWPAPQRDDEVWAMVAFLLAFPDLNAAEYRQLVSGAVPAAEAEAPIHDLLGPTEVPDAVTESCGRCHGVDGLGRGTGAFPRLAGQRPTYLYAALLAYARGERHSGIMEPIAAGLDLDEMRALARYYGNLEGPPLRPLQESQLPVQQETTQAIERGEAIAHRGIPGLGVPSCVDCHGPVAAPYPGEAVDLVNPFYPVLAGQYADYLALQLELFAKGHRGGSPYAHIMRQVAGRLTAEQMRDVALYYESLASALPPPAP